MLSYPWPFVSQTSSHLASSYTGWVYGKHHKRLMDPYNYHGQPDQPVKLLPSPAARLLSNALTTVGYVVPISSIALFLQDIVGSMKTLFGEDVFTSQIPHLLKVSCQTALGVVAVQAMWYGGKYLWEVAPVSKLRGQKAVLNEVERRLGCLRDIYSREPVPVMGVKKVFNCTPVHMVPLMEKRWRW